MKKKSEFSKFLLKQEAILIWIMSLAFLVLAFYCIYKGFTGSLPWLAAMVGFPWTAYGVSQAFYYTKSKAENTSGGIKFESILLEAQNMASKYQEMADAVEENLDISSVVINPNTEDISTTIDEYQI